MGSEVAGEERDDAMLGMDMSEMQRGPGRRGQPQTQARTGRRAPDRGEEAGGQDARTR